MTFGAMAAELSSPPVVRFAPGPPHERPFVEVVVPAGGEVRIREKALASECLIRESSPFWFPGIPTWGELRENALSEHAGRGRRTVAGERELRHGNE